MWKSFLSLLKKDFRLMLSGKFLLLAAGSLILYSCYINFVYVKLDQDIYPVWLYDPQGTQTEASDSVMRAGSFEELKTACKDGYSVGIDASGSEPEIYMEGSGSSRADNYRAAYAVSVLTGKNDGHALIIGENSKELKKRREITSEFLFFELTAIGILGIAAMLFKEKQMGVIRVHGVLPVEIRSFMISKMAVFLCSDLLFTCVLTVVNLGFTKGLAVLPGVLAQAGILSLIMALAGFYCAVRLHDFKQFSLLYLVLAIFITTPVFLAGQTGITWSWMNYHPMYYLFMAMKNAYFGTEAAEAVYYLVCLAVILLLFLAVYRALRQEMTKEG